MTVRHLATLLTLLLALATPRPTAAAGLPGEEELVGIWVGTGADNGGEVLVLRADGTATVGGLAATWSTSGKDRITYTLLGETERGRYTLDGDELVVTIDGEAWSYRRKEPKPEPKPRPRPKPGEERSERAPREEPAKERPPGVPPKLTGVDAGSATRFDHPRGWFSFEMPAGWSIAQETDDGMLVNPGLGPEDTLDALILLSYGQLEEADRNRSPASLIERYDAEFRREMQGQGIRLDARRAKARAVLVRDVPGGVAEWTGSVDGGQKVGVWLGAIVKRDSYLTVTAVVVDGQEERFLPKVKRIFHTLEARPPERNPALERLLAGRRVTSNDTSSSGSFSTLYEFDAGAGVKKTMMFSSEVGGSTSEEHGRYEVVGDELYMYFRDGQDSGAVLVEDGRLTGVRFGQRVYPAQ